MKRKLLAMISFIVMGGVNIVAQTPIDLEVGIVDETPIIPGGNRGPVLIPSLWQTGNQLTFEGTHDDFVMNIIDSNGVVYSTFISSSSTQLLLPSWLIGDFEIRLVANTYYYYGYITL